MTKLIARRTGFSLVEVVLVVVVVGLIGGLGWVYYNAVTKPSDSAYESTNTSKVSGDASPDVNTSADLDKAEAYLNSTDVDTTLNTEDIDQSLQ